MDLGARIVAWRKHKGWTQLKLATKLGLTPAAVCQWEGGRKRKFQTKPRTKHINAMVEAFGISMERFYGPVPKPKKKALGAAR